MLTIVRNYLLILILLTGSNYSIKGQDIDSLVTVHMSQIDSALVMFSRLDECLDVQAIKVVQIALKQAEISQLIELRAGLDAIISNQDRMIVNSDSIDTVQRRIIRSKDKEIKRQKRQKIIIGIVGVVLIILI